MSLRFVSRLTRVFSRRGPVTYSGTWFVLHFGTSFIYAALLFQKGLPPAVLSSLCRGKYDHIVRWLCGFIISSRCCSVI